MKNIFEPKNNLFVPWGCFIILIIFSAIVGYSINDIIEIIYRIHPALEFDVVDIVVCSIVLIIDIKVLEKWDIYIQESYKRKVNFHTSFRRKYNEVPTNTKDTTKHIENVIRYMRSIINQLADRADSHDESMLIEPEASEFNKIGGVNSLFHFNSTMSKNILDHHYKNNTHHIEHYDNGIPDMDLLDVIEMLCDWKDLSKRHDVDLIDYIKRNKEVYSYTDEICSILCNTAILLYKYSIYYTNKDGVTKIYYGDSIRSLSDMISDDDSINDIEKYHIKYGPNDEFLNHEYRSITTYGYRAEYKYVVNEFKLWA